MISIIIPVLNESQIIGSCLSRLAAEIDHHEIVVVDGGSRDSTLDIVSGFPQVRQVSASKGRGTQMNRGAETACGDIFLFLHADTHLPKAGLSRIESILRQKGVIAGSFSLRFDTPDPFLRLYSLFSRINHVLSTYGDQGLFMRRSVFQQIGGFREIPIMEDVEIQRRLRRMGRYVKIREPVTTSARRFLRRGVIRQQALNIGLVCLYLSGVSPYRIERFYRYP